MTVVELAIGYAGLGALIALATLVWRRGTGALDAILLLGLWPIYGPVLAAGATGPGPDPFAAELERRLIANQRRLVELDAVLARPDLDEAAARVRLAVLEQAEAAPGALATARRRLTTIHRLRELREAAAAAVEQLREALAQRGVQRELVRLGVEPDPGFDELEAELELLAGNEPASPGVAPS